METILAMAQVNPHVGNLEGNLELVLRVARQARASGADLVVFPELVLAGYPPEDLLHKPVFLERLEGVEAALRRGLGEIGIAAIHGGVRRGPDGLFNAGILVEEGRETGFVGKWCLPNYGVFDEWRYFQPGREVLLFPWRGTLLGITICEDIWHATGPMTALAQAGAQWVINLNASPYHVGKRLERQDIVARRIRETNLPVVYVNQVGGQDELLFDGGSFAMDRQGRIVTQAPLFREDVRLLRVSAPSAGMIEFQSVANPAGVAGIQPVDQPDVEEIPPGSEREIYQALCLGLADYVKKNGFKGVVLGLSGGIDSALTAVICVDALGPDHVEVVMMPSPFTSSDSLEDAADGARRLGIRLSDMAIGELFQGFRKALVTEFAGLPEGVAEENLQPRIRATLLMAISNKKGSLLVTTGNKSEVSVGYATLYGDMAGGFSVLKDVLKTTVYRLAEARNQWARAAGQIPPIPQRVLEKAPTAELKHNQKDTDSLPPYPLLDQILHLYVEQDFSLKDIVAQGVDWETAVRVIRMVDRNEYKRRQACPGVRITRRAFGKDRRYPITNGFQVT
ncbi:MAG: NAD+ synthase [Magnetococcus sp. DMHC-1]|nr:NAD+ synthase [Magnetococcales bacterium]